MSAASTRITFERTISGEPVDVFYAVSTSQGWRDWLADAAYFRSLPGRSFHLSWDTGWYASGTVQAVEKPGSITMDWMGKEAPGPTQVSVTLEPEGEKTRVQITHSGFGDGEQWEASREKAASGWESGLENLESIFDTGADLRVTRRPMLGIMGNDFNEEIAASIGVPVTEGTRLADAIEGMGAAKAGLQGDDVLVEMDGIALRSWGDLGPVLQRHQAGDTVNVVYYRGPELSEVEMKLMGRQIPDIDLDPTAFAQEYRKVTAKVVKELKQALDDVSEEEADFATEDDWSIKENLAHLVLGEEYNINLLTELLQDGEAQYAGGGANRRETLRAIVRTTPTIELLMQRLERAQQETCNLLEESQSVLSRRKGVMWRLGTYWLHFPGDHEREHMEQMMRDLEKARASEEVPA